MHITFQTCYDLQYIKMHLSGYINEPTEPDFIALILSPLRSDLLTIILYA